MRSGDNDAPTGKAHGRGWGVQTFREANSCGISCKTPSPQPCDGQPYEPSVSADMQSIQDQIYDTEQQLKQARTAGNFDAEYVLESQLDRLLDRLPRTGQP